MVAVRVRDYRDEDEPVVSRLMAEVQRVPLEVARSRGAAFASWFEQSVVAEVDGSVVGRAVVASPPMLEADSRMVAVAVDPPARRQGIGAALFDAALSELPVQVQRLFAFTDDRDDDAVLPWAAARSFRPFEHSLRSRLEVPAEGFPPVRLPARVTVEALVPADTADEAEIASLFLESDTSPEARDMGQTGWAGLLDFAAAFGGAAALVVARRDGAAVALALAVESAPEWLVVYTGVHPAHRGQGLAAMTKQCLHREAATRGATMLSTDNEADNHGIRAVNARLGYRVVSGQRRFVRDLRTDPLP